MPTCIDTELQACRDDWKYLTVQLNRTSTDESGDPDLYGLFAGGPHGEVRLIYDAHCECAAYQVVT